MANLTQLKKEIGFTGQLGSLLNVIKAIAAQQFQLLERSLHFNPAFFEAITAIAATFDLNRLSHPLTNGVGPAGVIAVTSDAGLLGGLNQQVILAAVRHYRKAPGELIVIGKRGVRYAMEQRVPFREFPGAQDETRRALAEQVRDYALNQVLAGRFGSLTIVYPRASSFTVQKVESAAAVPCQSWLQTAKVARGVRGRLLMESSTANILEYLVWSWLGQKLFEVLGMSRLAELAARAVHLEMSSQELQRRKDKLRRKYFRERHEVIDRGMRELFAAKALAKDEDR